MSVALNEDFQWFLTNFKELFEKYGDSFVAIKEKKVIGVYKTYAEGVRGTQKKEKLGTFIVQKCGRDESAYTNYIMSMNLFARG